MLQTERVVIIGTGLLGASIGLGLKRAGYAGEVVGVGRRAETLEATRSRGAADRVTTDYDEAVAAGSLVVVAVPLGGFAAVFDRLAQVPARAGVVVTDVGSTKVRVIREAAARLRADQPFVGSHPMAGSEQQGPEGARADLFEGKPCVVTRDGGEDPEAVATVEGLWATLGMPILHMTAAEHDRKTAAISHLPHAAAVAIIHAVGRLGGWEVGSTGLRDTTRLASSNPPMRADIMAYNREHLLEALDAFAGSIRELRSLVDRGDAGVLAAFLDENKAARDRWVGDRWGEG